MRGSARPVRCLWTTASFGTDVRRPQNPPSVTHHLAARQVPFWEKCLRPSGAPFRPFGPGARALARVPAAAKSVSRCARRPPRGSLRGAAIRPIRNFLAFRPFGGKPFENTLPPHLELGLPYFLDGPPVPIPRGSARGIVTRAVRPHLLDACAAGGRRASLRPLGGVGRRAKDSGQASIGVRTPSL